MNKKFFWLVVGSGLLLIAASLAGAQLNNEGGEPPPPPGLTWIDADWSIAGSYQEVQNVDPASSPGELVLQSDPTEMVQFLHAAPLVPFYNDYRKDNIFVFTPYSQEPHRLYFGLSSTLDGGCGVHNNLPVNECEMSELQYYDMTTDSRGTAFSEVWDFPEPALLRLKEFDGKLVATSNDNILDANFQTTYEYTPQTGWLAHYNAVSIWGGHISDVEKFNGQYYVGGGQWSPEISRHPDLTGSPTELWELVVTVDGYGNPTDPRWIGAGSVKAMAVYQGRLFVKTEQANRIDVFDGVNWQRVTLPVVGGYQIAGYYAKFRITNDKLFLLHDENIFMLDGVNSQWQYIDSTTHYPGGPPPHLVSWTSGHMGFNVFGDYIYVAGVVDPRSQGGGPMRTPQLWRKPISGGDWEMINPQVTDDEHSMRLRDIQKWHGRLFISDSRTPNVQPDDGLYPRIFAARCEDGGYLISAIHDFGAGVVSGAISWDKILPPGTELKFQIRSGRTQQELLGKNFVGPDGITTHYYTSPGNLWTGHTGDNLVQYKVMMAAADNGRLTPVLDSVTLTVQTENGPQVPTAPIGLSGLANNRGNVPGVDLSWSANPSEQGVTNYLIYRCSGNPSCTVSLLREVPGNTVSYRDTAAIINGLYYYYKISARNTGGEGPQSQAKLANPQADFTGPAGTPDGAVDQRDGQYLQDQFRKSGLFQGGGDPRCDLNYDGRINLIDSGIFNQWKGWRAP